MNIPSSRNLPPKFKHLNMYNSFWRDLKISIFENFCHNFLSSLLDENTTQKSKSEVGIFLKMIILGDINSLLIEFCPKNTVSSTVDEIVLSGWIIAQRMETSKGWKIAQRKNTNCGWNRLWMKTDCGWKQTADGNRLRMKTDCGWKIVCGLVIDCGWKINCGHIYVDCFCLPF